MAVIWIPALLRDFTAGQEHVTVAGGTLRQAFDELEARHPGIIDHLVLEDQLRPDLSVIVDGDVSHLKLRQHLSEDSEVHLLPFFSGG